MVETKKPATTDYSEKYKYPVEKMPALKTDPTADHKGPKYDATARAIIQSVGRGDEVVPPKKDGLNVTTGTSTQTPQLNAPPPDGAINNIPHGAGPGAVAAYVNTTFDKTVGGSDTTKNVESKSVQDNDERISATNKVNDMSAADLQNLSEDAFDGLKTAQRGEWLASLRPNESDYWTKEKKTEVNKAMEKLETVGTERKTRAAEAARPAEEARKAERDAQKRLVKENLEAEAEDPVQGRPNESDKVRSKQYETAMKLLHDEKTQFIVPFAGPGFVGGGSDPGSLSTCHLDPRAKLGSEVMTFNVDGKEFKFGRNDPGYANLRLAYERHFETLGP